VSGWAIVPTGEYPADWPEIARGVKDAATWRCVRCDAPHSRDGWRLERAGHSAPALVLSARLAEPFAQRLRWLPTVGARLRRLWSAQRRARRQERGQAPIGRHVAATAEQPNVLGRVVPGVAVLVVPVGRRCPALLTVTESVAALRPCALRRRARRVAAPGRVIVTRGGDRLPTVASPEGTLGAVAREVASAGRWNISSL
jgi:hypothetical protein